MTTSARRSPRPMPSRAPPSTSAAACTTGKLAAEAVVQVPLRMMNRHGLIAGATGTGKTVTLQTIAEQLSAAGVSVFAADVKGDVSGRRRARRAGGPPRSGWSELGLAVRASGFPVEYLSLGGSGPACRCARPCPTSAPSCSRRSSRRTRPRSRASSSSSTTRTRRACALLDLSDLRALLTFLESDAGKDELEGIGGLASSTVGVLLRALGRPRDRWRDRVLRRAPARHRRPDPHRARTAAA